MDQKSNINKLTASDVIEILKMYVALIATLFAVLAVSLWL